MDITITRKKFREDGIFGLMSEDGTNNHLGATIEHAYPYAETAKDGAYNEVGFMPKIPAGVYTAERYASPKHGYDVFRLLDVPGSDYDEIHIGNFNADSIGCICLGFQYILFPVISRSMVTFSTDQFRAFMKLQEGCDRITVTIKDEEE